MPVLQTDQDAHLMYVDDKDCRCADHPQSLKRGLARHVRDGMDCTQEPQQKDKNAQPQRNRRCEVEEPAAHVLTSLQPGWLRKTRAVCGLRRKSPRRFSAKSRRTH